MNECQWQWACYVFWTLFSQPRVSINTTFIDQIATVSNHPRWQACVEGLGHGATTLMCATSPAGNDVTEFASCF